MSAKRRTFEHATIVACLAAAMVGACRPRPEFDLAIRNGTIVDGSVQRLDVGIKGDRIAAVGDLSGRSAAESIDATGRIVAPGFIDVLSQTGIDLLSNGDAEQSLRQGITTVILGERTPAFWTDASADATALRKRGVTHDWRGLQGYFDRLEARGVAVNVGTLVPLSAQSTGSPIDPALDAGAFGVVDNVSADMTVLEAAANGVGQRNGVLVVPLESRIANEDTALDTAGARAHRIVIAGVERASSAQALTDLSLRVQRAAPRGVTVWPAVTIVPATADATDSLLVDALHKGSLVTNASGRGAFPRFLGQIVRDGHALDPIDAIRRITSMPASAFQIVQRGNVRERYFADLVVFDPQKIGDRATAGDPNATPAGIDYVVVNGVLVLSPRGPTGARPGYGLLRQGATR